MLPTKDRSVSRSRWAAVGAALAVCVGAGGLMSASAAVDSGERATYVPITPCRVMDTRPAPDNVGPRNTPIGANEAYAIDVRGANGNCTIPTDAVGLVMNVAAVTPSANSFLTVFPSDQTRPLAANLNWVAGQPPVSNAVTADISADGKVSFYNLAGTVHVTADIVGYYVDHNHDDRYYTETEIDGKFANQKFVSLDLLSLNNSGFITGGNGPGYGISLVDGGIDSFDASMVAPPDLTPGTPVRLQVHFHTSSTSCGVNLGPNYVNTARPGEVADSGSDSMTSVGGDVRTVPATGNTTQLAEFTIDRVGGLQPGDAIGVGVLRNTTGDTCTGTVVITGVRFLYS